MRVLVLSHMFPRVTEPIGGIFVHEQVRALRELGVKLVVIAPTPYVPPALDRLSWGRRYRKYVAVPATAVLNGRTVHYPRMLVLPRGHGFSAYGLSSYLGARGVVGRVFDEDGFDVVHAHAVLPDGFAGVLMGRRWKRPVVCTAHGSDINTYPFRSRLALAATRWVLRRVDRLVAVSHPLARRITSLVGPREVTVIHNGADPDVFWPRPRLEARRRLGLDTDKGMVLFVGNLVREKGVDLLLQAFARQRRDGAELYVVGDGELSGRLKGLAEALGLGQAVRFCGQRPHDEIPVWLSAADCLVMPSRSEGFPTLLPEAMLCRVPVVATNAGGIPDLVRAGQTGFLVAREDVSALAEAMTQALRGGTGVARMADEAERLVQGGFTWRANAERMRAVYASAVSGQEPMNQASSNAERDG